MPAIFNIAADAYARAEGVDLPPRPSHVQSYVFAGDEVTAAAIAPSYGAPPTIVTNGGVTQTTTGQRVIVHTTFVGPLGSVDVDVDAVDAGGIIVATGTPQAAGAPTLNDLAAAVGFDITTLHGGEPATGIADVIDVDPAPSSNGNAVGGFVAAAVNTADAVNPDEVAAPDQNAGTIVVNTIVDAITGAVQTIIDFFTGIFGSADPGPPV